MTAAAGAAIIARVKGILVRNRDTYLRELTPSDVEALGQDAAFAWQACQREIEFEDDMFNDELPEITI